MRAFDDENAVFKVVINEGGCYSIWPALRDCPPGWLMRDFRGSRSQCLEWIAGVWRVGESRGELEIEHEP